MKILTISLLLLTNYYIDCGVVQNLYDSVSDTSHDVKESLHGWWSYGKETIFGKDKQTLNENNRDQISTTNNSNEKGMIENLFTNFENRVLSVRQKIRDIIFTNKEGNGTEKKCEGFVENMYNRVKNKIFTIKDGMVSFRNKMFEPQQLNTSTIESAINNHGNIMNNTMYQEIQNKTRPVANTISKALFGAELNNLMDRTEFRDKFYSLVNEYKEKGFNVTESTKNALDKEKELMGDSYKTMGQNVNQFKTGSNIVGDDLKKLSNAAADAVRRDFEDTNKNKV